jgi:hypothetical protein
MRDDFGDAFSLYSLGAVSYLSYTRTVRVIIMQAFEEREEKRRRKKTEIVSDIISSSQ